MLDNWGGIDTDNTTLLAEWEAKEKEQAPIIAQAEADRLAAIADATKELARYEAEIAPRVAEAEKKRLADLAAAETAVKQYETKELQPAQAEFRGDRPRRAHLHRLDSARPAELTATAGVQLTKLPDGSIKAGGARPKSTDYVAEDRYQARGPHRHHARGSARGRRSPTSARVGLPMAISSSANSR